MLNLSSKDDQYTFTYDDVEHSIRALRVEELEEIAGALKQKPAKRAAAMKHELVSRADGDTRTLIEGMGLTNLAKLFQAWAGISLGESNGSVAS